MSTPLTHACSPALADALQQLHAGAQVLRQSVSACWPALSVEVVPQIDSTNAELMRRVRAGNAAPVVLAALRQSAGRGRLGRPWVTLPGASLAMSIGLPLAPPDWSGLSLAVGLALAEAIGPAVRLKWPNDLWWNERKLGGILIETAGEVRAPSNGRYCVIGIGINLATPALPPVAALDATAPTGLHALAEAQGEPPRDIGYWLVTLATAVLDAARAFESDGFAPLVARYAARDALRGRGVRLSDGREGIADGVDPDGALRLRTGAGLCRVLQGEVSVRPC